MKQCKFSEKYKGFVAPTCNDGKGCESCLAKYAERQKFRTLKSKKKYLGNDNQRTKYFLG